MANTATMTYRGIEFIKDFTVKYLTYIFFGAAKGRITLFNGFQEIKFSRTPTVIRKQSWDVRSLPSVLVGPISGNAKYASLSKDFMYISKPTDAFQARYVGGYLEYSLTLTARATTAIDCGNLADIVSIYMAHPDTKDYYLNQGLVIPSGPSISGETQLQEPAVDYPIFSIDVTVPIHSQWQDTYAVEDRLTDIISDISAELDL